MSNKIDMASIDWSRVETGYFVAKKSSTSQDTYKLEVVDKATLKACRKEKDVVCNLNKVIGIFNDSTVDRTISDPQIKSLKDRMEVASKKHNKHWYRCLRFLGFPILIAKLFRTDVFTTYQAPKTPQKEPEKSKKDEGLGGNPPPGSDIPLPVPAFRNSDKIYPLLSNKVELADYLKSLKEDDLTEILDNVLDLVETHSDLAPLIPIIFTQIDAKAMDPQHLFTRMVSLVETNFALAQVVVKSFNTEEWLDLLQKATVTNEDITTLLTPPWMGEEKQRESAKAFVKLKNLSLNNLDLIFINAPALAKSMNADQTANLMKKYLDENAAQKARLLGEQFASLPAKIRFERMESLFQESSVESIDQILNIDTYDWMRPVICLLNVQADIKNIGKYLGHYLSERKEVSLEMKDFAKGLAHIATKESMQKLFSTFLEYRDGKKIMSIAFEEIMQGDDLELKASAFKVHGTVMEIMDSALSMSSENVDLKPKDQPRFEYSYERIRRFINSPALLTALLNVLAKRKNLAEEEAKIILGQLLDPKSIVSISLNQDEVDAVLKSFKDTPKSIIGKYLKDLGL